MKEEILKPIEGYSDYLVSNAGNIYSIKFGKSILRKLYLTKKGYLKLSLSKNHKKQTFRVNRLVALHFIPNPFNKPQVNHLDGVKTNNNDWNLEWATGKENLDHAIKNNLVPVCEKHPNSKLTNGQVLEIRELHDKYTNQQLAEVYKVSRRTIRSVIRREVYVLL
jgi:RNase adaptor protein for sRNA GlmZ degradation